jgi:hypothetical protein
MNADQARRIELASMPFIVSRTMSDRVPTLQTLGRPFDLAR